MIPITTILLIVLIALFSAQSASPDGFEKYVMEKNYFSCDIPSGWQLHREAEKDAEYKIYEIQLISPDAGNTSIFVSYYAKDSEDFVNYTHFLERNSRNVAGETKNNHENYSPVKPMKLNGKKAFELERERMVSLHPESKSDESVSIKEKLYVVTAKEGFYVLHYSASKSMYNKHLPVFERVVKSFKAGR